MKKELTYSNYMFIFLCLMGVTIVASAFVSFFSELETVSTIINVIALVLAVIAIIMYNRKHEEGDERSDENLLSAFSGAFIKICMLMLFLTFIPDRLVEMLPWFNNSRAWFHMLIGIGILTVGVDFMRFERN